MHRFLTRAAVILACLSPSLRAASGSEEDLRAIYRETAKRIQPGDTFQHFALAHWCADKGLWDEFVVQGDSVLRVEPEHGPMQSLIAEHKDAVRLRGVASAGDPDARHGRELLTYAGGTSSPTLAVAARERVAALPDEVRYETMRRTFQSGSAKLQRMAVEILARFEDEKAVKLLVAAAVGLDDQPARTRAAEALRDREGAAHRLLPGLRSKYPAVRVYTAEALALIGDDSVVPALVAALAALHAPQASSSGGTVRSNLFVGTQTTYVSDFDVEIAQAAAIADPVVNVITDGVILDVAVLAVYHQQVEMVSRAYRGALRRLTSANPGERPGDWIRWYNERQR